MQIKIMIYLFKKARHYRHCTHRIPCHRTTHTHWPAPSLRPPKTTFSANVFHHFISNKYISHAIFS